MGVNSLPKTVTRGFDLNPGPTAPESSIANHSAIEPLSLHIDTRKHTT